MAFFGGEKKKKKGDAPPQNGEAADSDAPAPEDALLTFDKKVLAAARKWFQQGQKLTEDRNYDYAIESYLNGLKFWPEAVEEGHQLLRVAAYSRWEKGGKKPGMMDVMKHSMSGKDALQAMLNAEWLWSRNPQNVSYMEGMVKNTAKAKCEETLLFIGPIYFEAIKNEKKLSKDRFILLRKAYEELGNRCERRNDLQKAVTFFQGALTVLQILTQLSDQKLEFTQDLKDLATKVTIIKGQYDTTDDFRGSIKDSDAQKDIHDRERMVVDKDRLQELVTGARKDWQDNPNVTAKLINLVDLLCRDEKPDHENEAIKLLDDEFVSTKNYSYKMRADDIRIKQSRRKVRQAVADKDKEALRQAQLDQLRFELTVYKERVQTYSTDNKLKFEYGKHLIRARKFDEAIPILQEARNDPKNRISCMSLIGRCFYEKGFYAQAIATYNQAIEEYEIEGDDLGKELHYWLGRANEEAGNVSEAEKAFGQLIQWDYNYKDVRKRLEAMEK